MIEVTRISTPDEFLAIEGEWNGLLPATGSDTVHLTHEWLSSWIRTMREAVELLVLRFADSSTDEVLGYAPLMIRNTPYRGLLPYRQILFLGDSQSDFSDFLIVREREKIIRMTLDYLFDMKGWGEILLHNIPEISPNFPVVSQLLQQLGVRHAIKTMSNCYYIPIGELEWAEYYKSTSKEYVRNSIPRLRNRYAELPWTFLRQTTEIAQHMPMMQDLYGQSQRRMSRDAGLDAPEMDRFLRDVIRSLEPAGVMVLYSLMIEDEHAAFVLGFEFENTFHYWIPGFAEKFSRLAPSKFLLYQILFDGSENNRWGEFNFMRGTADYKQRWAKQHYGLMQIGIRNSRGLYGMLNRLRK